MVDSKLFCIKDIVSGLRITSFLEFVNEGVALQAFKKFVDEKPAESRMCFKLLEVGRVKDDYNLIPTGNVVCSGDQVDEALNEFIKIASEKEGD